MSSRGPNLCFAGNMLGNHPSYVPSQGQILADLFARTGYDVSCVSSKINRVWRLTDILQTIIRGSKEFDLVVFDTFSGLNFVVADLTSLVCTLRGVRLVMVLHGGNLPNFVKRHPFWTRRVFNRAHALVAPSAFLGQAFGKLGYSVRVIPNVLDLTNYPFRERRHISPRFLWMRSFHDLYNPEMAVRVFAKIHEDLPEATLTMAGSDKGREGDVKGLVSRLGLLDSVRFAGFLDLEQKIEEFSKADVYLHTNRVDNMPVSVLEALALGLPVAATNVGGLPYLIKHNETGLLSPSEDIDAMVRNIRLLLNSPELTRKISRNGRNLAEHSAWTSIRSAWEDLFTETLNLLSPMAGDTPNEPEKVDITK